jgi:bifunctional UDP-N-acetylglucosamine pyrophosphorylase/glucosamine-1-phosphate N-acetyltransferase
VSVDVIILAAGKGTRMKSSLPKVLHPLGGRPMVLHSVRAARQLSDRPPVLVIGHGAEAVREAAGESARCVLQEEQLGTGHAVMQARELLQNGAPLVMVIYADMPLLQAETMRSLLELQKAHPASPFSMLTQIVDQPRAFGRIVRDGAGKVVAIVEEADATPEQLAVREVNLGIYCFRADWLWAHLDHIPLNAKGEYYLTDLVAMAVAAGGELNAVALEDTDETIGINSKIHLAEAEAILRRRVNEALMLAGVTLIDPATTYVDLGVEIGADTVIQPNTTISGATRIGAGCTIGPNTVIRDSQIGDDCVVFSSVVEGAVLEDGVDIGPYAHLRKGAYLESGVHMGNFGEVKNSRLRRGVKMGHFSYIGDGDIGEGSNIGAGTITCNYDGKNKHKTLIGKGVFIGSDTMLVAPVTIGDGARTGAGSVVTKDVPPGALAYGVPARLKPEPETNEEKREA